MILIYFFFIFLLFVFFFFNDTATTEIYTLSLHDALPIGVPDRPGGTCAPDVLPRQARRHRRSEEHTSELQSPYEHVCRLLLEKKKTKTRPYLASSKESYPRIIGDTCFGL